MSQACFRVIAPSVSSGPGDEKRSAALRDLRDDDAGDLGGGRRSADVEGAHIAAAEDLVDSTLQLRRGLLVAVLSVPVPEGGSVKVGPATGGVLATENLRMVLDSANPIHNVAPSSDSAS